MTRRAILLGGTGLIGAAVMKLLCQASAYQEVVVISRRAATLSGSKCRNRVMPLEQLADAGAEFVGADVFCCLGTTIKQAGSREMFRHVDHDLVVLAAKVAAENKAARFLVVSAVNASTSGLAFYSKVKGDMERAVGEQGLPLVAFMQPSLLEGHRQEFRLGEEIGQRVISLLRPLISWTQASWLPISFEVVARAMVSVALRGPESGKHRYRYRDMVQLSGKLVLEE